MREDVLAIGTLTVRRRDEESYQGYSMKKKKSIGRIVPFHVTDDNVDIQIGYAIFTGGERDIRALEVRREFKTFGRLLQGLRLGVLPVPRDSQNLYMELKQALPRDSFNAHQTLHPTISELDLDQGSGLRVFAELEKVGATAGRRKDLLGDTGRGAERLCARFSKSNLWAPIVGYITTRILPMRRGYTGIEIV